MALCAYHEDTESVATCAVCKSPICASCQDHGADGMCGMCLEMSNARRATAEASRQARVDAASQGPARPVAAPAAAPPRPPAVNGKPPRPPGAPQPARGGFCSEHDGQQATAMCTHCQKKVCPYCLDLYDHCPDCRLLPHCSRHESMVSAAKCESCKLDYCRLCLDNSPFCDRCRTLGMAKVSAAKTGGTGKLKAPEASGVPATARKGTGELNPSKAPPRSVRTPTGELPGAPKAGPRPPLVPPKPGQPGYRPPGRGQPAPPSKRSTGTTMAYVGGALLLLGAAAWVLLGDGKARLTSEEAAAAVRQEMEMVRNATITIKEQTGKWPSSVDVIKKQLVAQGVDLKDLNPPLVLVLNGPATEPNEIMLNTQGVDGFEVRALDAAGSPLAENGRDVVLGPPKPKKAVTKEVAPPAKDNRPSSDEKPQEGKPAKEPVAEPAAEE